MNGLNTIIKAEFLCHSADLVGFGDLTELPTEVRQLKKKGEIYPPNVR